MTALGAIILAAGEGERYGGPKALAVSGGRFWMEISLATLRAGGVEEIVAVIGARADEVRALLPAGVTAVENGTWRQGRTGSIQAGLRALTPACGGALLHQVDFPEVRPETVRALAAAFAGLPRAEDRILVPVDGGRRGHPIVLGQAIWPEVAALSADEPLRTVVHRDPARVIEIPVADPGIHRNRNVPSAEDR